MNLRIVIAHRIADIKRIQRGFARMVVALANGKEKPLVAIVVSKESNDYRGEMDWLAHAVTATGQADAVTVAPENVVFTEEAPNFGERQLIGVIKAQAFLVAWIEKTQRGSQRAGHRYAAPPSAAASC